MHAVALFAGGAFAASGIWLLARSLASSGATGDRTRQKQAVSDAAAPAGKAAPEPLPVDPLTENAPPSGALDSNFALDSADRKGGGPAPSHAEALFRECGVMGLPRSNEPPPPPARHLDARMSLHEVAEPRDSAPPVDTDGLVTGTHVIDRLAYRHSRAVFSYESAANGGLGAYSEAQACGSDDPHTAEVFVMQARAGAGSAVAGYLAGSADDPRPVSILTNAPGFQAMGPALAGVPPEHRERLVLQVSAASQATSEDLRVTNDYAAVLSTAALLGDHGYTVVLSGSRQEAVDLAHYAYARGERGPIVHVFDGAFGARELGPLEVPAADAPAPPAPSPFAYTGPANPETVLMLPNGTLALKARAALLGLSPAQRKKVGVLSMRTVCPWNAAELRAALPEGVRSVRLLEEAFTTLGGLLYETVLGSALAGELGPSPPVVQSVVLTAGAELSGAAWTELLRTAAESATAVISPADVQHRAEQSAAPSPDLLALSKAQLVSFFGGDRGTSKQAAEVLAGGVCRSQGANHVRELARFDNYGASGVVRADVVYAEWSSTELPMQLLTREGAAHLVVLSDPTTLLRAYDVLASLRPRGTVLISAPGWTADDVEANLCAADKRKVASLEASLVLVDLAKAAEALDVQGEAAALHAAAAAAAVAPEKSAPLSAWLERVRHTAPFDARVSGVGEFLTTVSYDAHAWANATDEQEADAEQKRLARPTQLHYNSYGPNPLGGGGEDASSAVVRSSWALAAWQMLFREAYALDDQALRPDLPERTWNVTVTENRRLTPTDYDRNVFHMELSTEGTDLHYEVGEALGVHGWNDDEEVREFIDWAGYNAEEVLSVPSVVHPGRSESRTVFQMLQQNLDIFGKPPKQFFEELGKLVKSKDEARWLRFISAAEGTSTFKKLSESETVTYADVLHMFPSTRVPLDWLVRHVEPIKPRHYSIASAEAAVGNSVHLLIVTVDWRTPHGSPRFGQCTRYLSTLKPGTRVTVSLKPSVMKLPPLESQPIIMAGLGTGAAPFRAFIQAREVQRAQGKEIGPLFYYFGSRYQSAEYLYGEELEAYLRDGILTHMGLAFSRDTPHKVYVQHKIKQDGQRLAELLAPELLGQSSDDPGKKGIFTLCGPVWPVPDIHAALVEAFSELGLTKEQAEAKLDELKEQERYVLEVY